MFIFTYTAAGLAFIFFGFAAFVLIKKRHNSLATFLVLHMVADAVWIGSNAGADVATTDFVLVFWSGMAFIGASFHVSFFLCFVDNFIYNRCPRRIVLFIYLLPSLLFSPFVFSKYSVQETIFPANIPTQIVPGVMYKIYPFFFFGSLLYAGLQLVRAYRKAEWRKRRQVAYLSIGFIFLFSGNIVFTVILPLLGELRFFNVGPQFSIFFIGLSAYVIFRHRLLDIKVVIQRSLIYAVILFVIVSFYLAVLLIFQSIFDGYGHSVSLVSALVTISLGIFGVPRIEKIFRRLTDRIFFKDNYDYSQALHELSEILSKNMNLKDLLGQMQNKLKQILKVGGVYYLLMPQNLLFDSSSCELEPIEKFYSDDLLLFVNQYKEVIIHSELPYLIEQARDKGEIYQPRLSEFNYLSKKYQVAITVPLLTDDKLVGLLCLTAKLSGDAYSDQDVRLLKTVSYQTASGLEKAKLYKQVRDYSFNLEKKVKQRTEKIRSLQKRQAQMIFDISHQLQTPLTIIKGEVGSLRHLHGIDSLSLKSFETSVDRLSKFTTGLLSLAKLDFESNGCKRETVNLSELLNELVEYFSVLAVQKNIQIITDIKPGIFINGQKDRLEELVTNLVSNSFKYIANQRQIKISLSLCNNRAVIIVEDTGLGIARESLPHLFKRFYRSRSQNSQVRGSGLGLAICKRIVMNHEGRIYISSESGSGTRVTVELPIFGLFPTKLRQE